MSERNNKERLLKQFNFNEPSNIFGLISNTMFIPLQTASETPLTMINLDKINANDRVLIQATVNWIVAVATTEIATNPEIRFTIRRDNPPISNLVFTTIDSVGTPTQGEATTTSLFHSEKGLTPGGHSYTLSAQIVTGTDNQLVVVGPIHLAGSLIDENGT